MTDVSDAASTSPSRPHRPQIVFAGFVAALVLALVAWWVTLTRSPYEFTGTLVDSSEPSADFTLSSATGPVSVSDYRGKLVVLFFGYVFCPDVCPATLAESAKALDRIEEADEIQVVFVSLDPERDTPESVAQYVSHFDPGFVGITGAAEDIEAIASAYGVYYAKEAGATDRDYLVEHTAHLLVLDREGYLRLVIPFGADHTEIAADLEHLL